MVDIIYHEKQQGFFCAQHCLNNLLQGQYFTAGDLADIAHQLDVQERAALGQTPSGTSCLNSDATGFFSVQVIIQALRNLGLEVVPLLRKCPEAEAAREDPTQQVAFICHFMQHWFTIRKLGYQWFDLNSMLSRPKLISDTYLSLYLAQLRQEGNSIYFVTGNIPECEADRYLRVLQTIYFLLSLPVQFRLCGRLVILRPIFGMLFLCRNFTMRVMFSRSGNL
uniref:ubiquitinyl hydrolase 1 n=1 Tax=Schistocephalus solidus TaxID=70667 RepID=A0A0X3P884_SCHSO